MRSFRVEAWVENKEVQPSGFLRKSLSWIQAALGGLLARPAGTACSPSLARSVSKRIASHGSFIVGLFLTACRSVIGATTSRIVCWATIVRTGLARTLITFTYRLLAKTPLAVAPSWLDSRLRLIASRGMSSPQRTPTERSRVDATAGPVSVISTVNAGRVSHALAA